MAVGFHHIRRVMTAIDRVDKPAVAVAVEPASRVLVGLAGRGGAGVDEVEDDAHLCIWAVAPDDGHSPAVGK